MLFIDAFTLFLQELVALEDHLLPDPLQVLAHLSLPPWLLHPPRLPLEQHLQLSEHLGLPCPAAALLHIQEATSNLASPLKDLPGDHQLNHTREDHQPKGILEDPSLKEDRRNMVVTLKLRPSSPMVGIMEDPQDQEVTLVATKVFQEAHHQLRVLHSQATHLLDLEDHQKGLRLTLGLLEGLQEVPVFPQGSEII